MQTISPNPLVFLLVFFSFQISHAQLFGPENALSVGEDFLLIEIKDLHVVDLDSDGDNDLLLGGRTDLALWFENLGNERWESHILSNNIGSNAIFGADLNGDGHKDVITSSRSNSKIFVFYNLGDNTFTSKQIFDDGVANVSDIVCADTDGDGDVEIFATHNKRIVWYENFGGGSFSSRRTITTSAERGTDLAIDDMNGDGLPDIVNITVLDGGVAWYENLGGNFGGQNVLSMEPTVDLKGLLLRDLDNDGDLDILRGGSYLGWHENLGGGLFASPVQLSSEYTDVVETADLDTDGDLDIYISTGTATIVEVENLGAGNFNSATVLNGIDRKGAGKTYHLYIQDFGGDGFPDVLTWSIPDVTFANGSFYIWKNAGAGVFPESPLVELPASVESPRSVSQADLDGDGDVDILYGGAYSLGWYASNGDGSFEDIKRLISIEANVFTSVFSSDMDGDGDVDVIACSTEPDRILFFENLGGDVFGPMTIVSGAIFNPNKVYAADLDNDGDSDILSASISDNKIAWYENQGSGLFVQHVLSSSIISARSVYASDLDNDGDLDVLGVSYADSEVVWFENLGGTFSSAISINSTAGGPFDVRTADFDADGDQDVLVAQWIDDEIVWYENLGGGSFSAGMLISSSADGPRSLFTGDLDNDGDTDILSASNFDSKVAWYENLGGSFGPQQIISDVYSEAYGVSAGDFDGDGDLDIATIATTDDRIAWFENLSPQNCELPPVPSGFSYSPATPDGTLQLNWTFIPSAQYQVRIEKTSSAVPKSKLFLSNINSLSITAPFKPWHTYRWKVRAACPADTSGWSPYALIDIPPLREMTDELVPFGVIAFPNPAAETITIALPGQPGELWRIMTFDQQGKLVLDRTISSLGDQATIEVSSLPSGQFYFSLKQTGELEHSSEIYRGSFLKE